MAVSVMILGVSGTGKSASMRNCKSDKFALVNVAKKPLPFKGNFDERYDGDSYNEAVRFMQNCKAKSIVIDDAQYLMGNEFMRRVTERGYDKFSEMAQNMWKLLNFINQDLPSDKIVYLLGHIERDQDGNEKFKTMGKLIDQCINVEGTCTIVLKTHVADGQYSFLTQNSGHDTVKSPIGMFPSYAIDNDLNYVDEKIRNYYEVGDFKSDEEIAEADKEAAKEEIEKPSTEKKSRRARQKPAEARSEEPKGDEHKNTQSDEEEPKKRKRRARRPAVTKPDAPAPEEGFMNVPDDISDEEVPFTGGEPTTDEEPTPTPNRKRRTADSTEEIPAEEPKEEAPAENAASATRRRRRRA